MNIQKGWYLIRPNLDGIDYAEAYFNGLLWTFGHFMFTSDAVLEICSERRDRPCITRNLVLH